MRRISAYALDVLFVTAAALVTLSLKILPLPLHLLVGLHLDLTFTPFETVLLIDGDEMGKHQGIGSLGTVFGQDTDHLQVNDTCLMKLQGSKQMPPSEGE